jgi:hypothetical protein
MLTILCVSAAIFLYKALIVVLAWTGKLFPAGKTTEARPTTPPAVEDVFYLESIQGVLQHDRSHAQTVMKDTFYQEEMKLHG